MPKLSWADSISIILKEILCTSRYNSIHKISNCWPTIFPILISISKIWVIYILQSFFIIYSVIFKTSNYKIFSCLFFEPIKGSIKLIFLPHPLTPTLSPKHPPFSPPHIVLLLRWWFRLWRWCPRILGLSTLDVQVEELQLGSCKTL